MRNEHASTDCIEIDKVMNLSTSNMCEISIQVVYSILLYECGTPL